VPYGIGAVEKWATIPIDTKTDDQTLSNQQRTCDQQKVELKQFKTSNLGAKKNRTPTTDNRS